MQYKEECLNFSKDEIHKEITCDLIKFNWSYLKDIHYCPTYCPYYIDRKEVTDGGETT